MTRGLAAEPVAESVAGFVAGFVAGCLKAASIPRPPMTPIPFVITLIRSSVPKSGKSSGSIGIGSTGARKWIAPPPPSLSLGKEGRSTLLADGSDVHSRSVSGAGGEEETPPPERLSPESPPPAASRWSAARCWPQREARWSASAGKHPLSPSRLSAGRKSHLLVSNGRGGGVEMACDYIRGGGTRGGGQWAVQSGKIWGDGSPVCEPLSPACNEAIGLRLGDGREHHDDGARRLRRR